MCFRGAVGPLTAEPGSAPTRAPPVDHVLCLMVSNLRRHRVSCPGKLPTHCSTPSWGDTCVTGQGLLRPAERAKRVSHQDQYQPDTGRCHCGPYWGTHRLTEDAPPLACHSCKSLSTWQSSGAGQRASWGSPGGQSGHTGQIASFRTGLLACRMQHWFSVVDAGSLTSRRKHRKNTGSNHEFPTRTPPRAPRAGPPVPVGGRCRVSASLTPASGLWRRDVDSCLRDRRAQRTRERGGRVSSWRACRLAPRLTHPSCRVSVRPARQGQRLPSHTGVQSLHKAKLRCELLVGRTGCPEHRAEAPEMGDRPLSFIAWQCTSCFLAERPVIQAPREPGCPRCRHPAQSTPAFCPPGLLVWPRADESGVGCAATSRERAARLMPSEV